MEFNIIQIALVGIVGFIAAIDQFNFLESLYQPIVTGPVVGAILGDVQTGLIVGGTYQLMAIGNMPVGGAQPPNAVIGGIMATIFAVGSNLDVNAAVGLAIPFSLIGQYFVVLLFTAFSIFMERGDKAAADANPGGIVKLNYATMGILGISFAFVCILGLVGGSALGNQLDTLSKDVAWLMSGLSAAGGMMRYVGFAVLLKIMLSNDLWGIYFGGFALATIIGATGPTLLLVAFIGGAIAIYEYQSSIRIKEAGLASNSGRGGEEDGI